MATLAPLPDPRDHRPLAILHQEDLLALREKRFPGAAADRL